MEKSANNKQVIMTVIAVVVGIFLITVAPVLTQISLDRVITELLVVVEEKPAFDSGVNLFNLFYPIWRAICFIAGIALLVISPAIYKEEEWTYPVAMLAYALPSIGGMFMFLPYISWVGGFPLPMTISWVGLAGFWSMIFLRKGTKLAKFSQFLTLTFLGMLTTHAFTIGIGAQRMLATRPGQPLFEGLEWWILTWAGEVNWMAVVMMLIAIPLLVMRKRSGWWLALIAAVSILAIDAPTQIIRTKTLDYLYGSILSIGVIVSLIVPVLKKNLMGEVETEA